MPGVIGAWMRGPETDAAARAHAVEQILDRIPAMNGWRGRDRPKKDDDYDWLRDQASRGKAAMERAAELAEKLGDNAPEMEPATSTRGRGRTASPSGTAATSTRR